LNVFIIFFRVLAVTSPGSSDDKQLLVYWIVYSLFNFIDYVGYGFFNLLLISIDCVRYCLSNSALFYWLGKTIFLIWFMNSGSRMISRWFVQDTDTPAQNTDDMSAEDIDLLNSFQKRKHTLYIKLII
jgi:hypothetical protein